MNSPFTSYHDAAQKKQERRRGAAQSHLVVPTSPLLAQLQRIGLTLFPDSGGGKNYDTVAIGYLATTAPCWLPDIPSSIHRIIVAIKGVKSPPSAKEVQAAAAAVLGETKGYDVITLIDHVSDTAVDEPAHLHAEMAIVQFVVNGLGVPKNQLGGAGLQIACIGKGVCPDCSGWMVRHGIVHSVTRKTVASTGWTHPLSGAFFKYQGASLQYNKLVAGIKDTATAKDARYPKG